VKVNGFDLKDIELANNCMVTSNLRYVKKFIQMDKSGSTLNVLL